MLTSRQAVFRRFWHAVAPIAELGDRPLPVTLMGERLVLFRDPEGRPAALRDRCAHRTARLSLGRVDGGRLACGYHGWAYDRDGRVVRIPQYPPERPLPDGYAVPAHRCVERYGYAWVALDEPIAPIPEVPEYGAPGWRTIFQFWERWDTSPLRVLENAFDNAHFSFVHRATFGVAAQPVPSRYELVETDDGFRADTVIDAANPPGLHRVSGVSDPVTTRRMRNAWYLPFCRRLDIEYPSGVRHVIFNCFAPIDDGSLQLAQWLFRNDTEADCPAATLIAFDHAITREDKAILESTDPDAPVDLGRRGIERSMDSDRPGLVMRRRLMALLAAHGETEVHG